MHTFFLALSNDIIFKIILFFYFLFRLRVSCLVLCWSIGCLIIMVNLQRGWVIRGAVRPDSCYGHCYCSTGSAL